MGSEVVQSRTRKSMVEALYPNDPYSRLKIELDKEANEFSPGEVVTGKIALVLNKPLELKEISITATGSGRTSWAVTKVIKAKGKKRSSNASVESYMDETFSVTGDGVNATTIPTGRTEFPFKYTLPSTRLPSTFIDAFGSVTYVLKAHAVTSVEVIECLCPILINGKYDLNEDPELNQQAELYDHKKVGCCCIRSGKVELLVKFPRRGYVLGDRISWKAELTNESKNKVRQVTARLLQRCLFHAQSENKEDTKLIVEVHAGAVGKKGSEQWEGFLDIPLDIPPTRLGGSTIIVVNYVIQFELLVAGCTKSLKSEIPIGVGTVGLKGSSGGADAVSQFGKKASPPKK